MPRTINIKGKYFELPGTIISLLLLWVGIWVIMTLGTFYANSSIEIMDLNEWGDFIGGIAQPVVFLFLIIELLSLRRSMDAQDDELKIIREQHLCRLLSDRMKYTPRFEQGMKGTSRVNDGTVVRATKHVCLIPNVAVELLAVAEPPGVTISGTNEGFDGIYLTVPADYNGPVYLTYVMPEAGLRGTAEIMVSGHDFLHSRSGSSEWRGGPWQEGDFWEPIPHYSRYTQIIEPQSEPSAQPANGDDGSPSQDRSDR